MVMAKTAKTAAKGTKTTKAKATKKAAGTKAKAATKAKATTAKAVKATKAKATKKAVAKKTTAKASPKKAATKSTATKKAAAKKTTAKASPKKAATKSTATKKAAAKKTTAKASASAAKTTAKAGGATRKKAAKKSAGTKKTASSAGGEEGEGSEGDPAPSDDERRTRPLPLEAGALAPAFSLQDDSARSVALKGFPKSRAIILYFYPKALTSGCTAQACALRDARAAFVSAGVTILGISPDPVSSLAKFKEREKLNFPLLSDPDHKVAENYGVWGEKSLYGRKYMGVTRSTFIIGPDGRILHAIPKVNVKTHLQDLLEWIRAHLLG